MSKSELYKKGAALRTELFGEKHTKHINETVYGDPMMQQFRDVITETVFGALWSRPGLDLKTRTLVCVVSDVAAGRDPELRLHLRMARKQGWTEEELTEVLLHLCGYVGAPLIRESMLSASEVFQALRDEAQEAG